MNNIDVGWREYQQQVPHLELSGGDHVGRVIAEHKTNVVLATDEGDRTAVVRGKAHRLGGMAQKPKVGDWVVYEREGGEGVVAIEKMLPRYSLLQRRGAGNEHASQVLVTNIDFVIIVQGLDANFNINRLERYLVMVDNSGAQSIVVLNKVDLVDDPEQYRVHVQAIAPDVPVVLLSALTDTGVDELLDILQPQTTSVFVGSSGVGKSTLLNRLLDSDIQSTQGLRDDDQGKHTTTHREMFLLPSGAIVIDTPGMRELSVKGLDTLGDTFTSVEQLTEQCRFRDCDHEKSKGCALLAAVEDGSLDRKQYANYLKLRREVAYANSQVDDESKYERKKQQQELYKSYRKITRAKYKDQGFR